MTTSISLLRDRVVAAAKHWAKLTTQEPLGTLQEEAEARRALRRAVLAYEAEEWRSNDAAVLVKELLELAKLKPATSANTAYRAEILRKAEAFIGQRQVADDTAPVARPRRGILRRKNT